MIEQNVARSIRVAVADILAAVRSMMMSVSTWSLVKAMLGGTALVVGGISIYLAWWRGRYLDLQSEL